eukprot:1057436-Amorphochlora_amoeboformis.AAC.1
MIPIKVYPLRKQQRQCNLRVGERDRLRREKERQRDWKRAWGEAGSGDTKRRGEGTRGEGRQWGVLTPRTPPPRPMV